MNDTQLTLTRIALGTAALVATLSAPITVACAAIGGFGGASLSEHFADSAKTSHAQTSPAPAHIAQAKQERYDMLSKHFVHNFAVN